MRNTNTTLNWEKDMKTHWWAGSADVFMKEVTTGEGNEAKTEAVEVLVPEPPKGANILREGVDSKLESIQNEAPKFD